MTLDLTLTRREGNEKVTVRVESNDRVNETLDDLKSYWKVSSGLDLYRDDQEIEKDDRWQDTEVQDGDMLILRSQRSVKTLTIELWRSRVDNEASNIQDHGIETEMKEDSMDVTVYLKDVSAPIKVGKKMGLAFNHRLKLVVPRTYPYEPPTVRWETSIFHPNINLPEDGGEMSFSGLDNWSFDENLSDLLEQIEGLLTEPELENTMDTPTCRDAAEEYRENGFPSPREG